MVSRRYSALSLEISITVLHQIWVYDWCVDSERRIFFILLSTLLLIMRGRLLLCSFPTFLISWVNTFTIALSEDPVLISANKINKNIWYNITKYTFVEHVEICKEVKNAVAHIFGSRLKSSTIPHSCFAVSLWRLANFARRCGKKTFILGGKLRDQRSSLASYWAQHFVFWFCWSIADELLAFL